MELTEVSGRASHLQSSIRIFISAPSANTLDRLLLSSCTHTNDCISEDLPTPQITIWGELPRGYRVFPIRDLDTADVYCTVMVPADASPLQYSLRRVVSARPLRRRGFRLPGWSAARRHGCRWQPEVPPMLQSLAPADFEELWPVQEIVVHFVGRAPHRSIHPMETESREILGQVMRSLRLSCNCALRLPTCCPAEEGAPLHLFLHQYDVLDPWNDPPEDHQRSFGLIDMRRLTVPPRPQYFLLPLPQVFDLMWLREAIALEFPELPYVSTAYLGTDMIVEHCSLNGNTPLITVLPNMHFLFEPSSLADCILDTHALLDLRPGFRQFSHVDRTRERQSTFSASASEDRSSAAGTRRPSACFPALAAAVQCAEPCTLHIPTLSPLVPGHVPCAVIVPSRQLDRRFLLVDARTVMRPGHEALWLQESASVVNPVILITALTAGSRTAAARYYVLCNR